jgi:hypothetical protein
MYLRKVKNNSQMYYSIAYSGQGMQLFLSVFGSQIL